MNIRNLIIWYWHTLTSGFIKYNWFSIKRPFFNMFLLISIFLVLVLCLDFIFFSNMEKAISMFFISKTIFYLNYKYASFFILILVYYLANKYTIKYMYNEVPNIVTKFILNTVATTIFFSTINLWFSYDSTWPGYQSLMGEDTISIHFQLNFGIDGISLCFLTLTSFIFALLFLYLVYDKTISINFIYICLIIEIFLLLSFYTINLLLFYIFFESVLIPMFLMIIFWGSSPRRIKAAIYFLLYTIIGSIFLLYAILYIYNNIGTLNYQNLTTKFLSNDEEIVLWLAFFFPFAVKIPMFPFHIWLPEAHVEAPTIGSIILASLLLKLGGYGFLRFTLPLFPYANDFFFPLIYMLGVTGVVNASLIAIRQIDIKRIIAYSSIAHMNLIVLGLFSTNEYGINGAIYLMIGHGLVSAALFFCIGVLYDRYHTRLIHYYGGLVQIMPKFTVLFFIFSFANMGFPGTVNFIGEFLILLGIFQENFFCGLFATSSTIFSAIYSIYLFNRISFGTIKTYINIKNSVDLTLPEFLFLLILAISTILLGLNSDFILEPIQFSGHSSLYSVLSK